MGAAEIGPGARARASSVHYAMPRAHSQLAALSAPAVCTKVLPVACLCVRKSDWHAPLLVAAVLEMFSSSVRSIFHSSDVTEA